MKKSVIILLLVFALFSALVSAIDLKIPSCNDYCSDSTYYHDGYFSVRAGKCDYQTTSCRYGCAGSACASAPARIITPTEPQVPEPTGPPLTLTEKCPDFCSAGIYYYGGDYSHFTGECDYPFTSKCSAGCNEDYTGCKIPTGREEPDKDNDGLPDSRDPCPNDFTNDRDNDGACEDVDNCPGIPNKDQKDTNHDGEGDVCDCNDKIQSENEEGIDCGGYCLPCDLCNLDVLPTKFDWRKWQGKNWVTPVKNQAMCGSCWAFGTIGAIEARFNIENDKPFDLDLSEQELVSDCGHKGSCFGGFAGQAYDFAQNKGIVTESCYPYQSQHCLYKNVRIQGGPEYLCDQTCQHKDSEFNDFCSNPGSCNLCNNYENQLWYIQTYATVPNDIPTIKRAIVCKGPLTAGSVNWEHVILILGWDDAKKSWIIKNSWGTGWGSNGYSLIPYDGHDYSDIKNELYWPWGVYSPAYSQIKELISEKGLVKP